MLNALNLLGQTYTLQISEIAGGAHSTLMERHYKGLAIRVTHVNDVRVSSTHPKLLEFVNQAKVLGATAVYYPTGNGGLRDNIYVAWSDISEVNSTTSTP